MLEQLCKKDTYWRKVALKICKDKMLADDLVSDMYLRLMECEKEINDFYVIVTIKNLFLQHLKQNKTVALNDNYSTPEPVEFDDLEKEVIENVYWVAREYIELNETMSLRAMGEMLNTNHRYIHGIIKKEKLKWQEKSQ